MTVAHHIYLVQGHTGEYDDRASWTVAWRMTPEDAESLRAACQAHADAWQHASRSTPGAGDEIIPHYSAAGHPLGITYQTHLDAGPDPFMRIDYTGVNYRVLPIADDPRAAA